MDTYTFGCCRASERRTNEQICNTSGDIGSYVDTQCHRSFCSAIEGVAVMVISAGFVPALTAKSKLDYGDIEEEYI